MFGILIFLVASAIDDLVQIPDAAASTQARIHLPQSAQSILEARDDAHASPISAGERQREINTTARIQPQKAVVSRGLQHSRIDGEGDHPQGGITAVLENELHATSMVPESRYEDDLGERSAFGGTSRDDRYPDPEDGGHAHDEGDEGGGVRRTQALDGNAVGKIDVAIDGYYAIVQALSPLITLCVLGAGLTILVLPHRSGVKATHYACGSILTFLGLLCLLEFV